MSNKVEIRAVKIPESVSPGIFDVLMKSISVEKRDKISRFHHMEDAMRSLFADVLLRTMLCKQENIKNDDLIFGHYSYGKPYLTNKNRIEFNISHSGEWVICAVYNSKVGIDIEKVKEIKYLELSQRYFSKQEVQNLMKKPKEVQLEHFYNIWTLKESYIKNIGCGLSMPLSSFTITQTDGNFHVIDKQELGNREYKTNYQFFQYLIDDKYICSVCVEDDSEITPSKVRIYNSQLLINEFTQYI